MAAPWQPPTGAPEPGVYGGNSTQGGFSMDRVAKTMGSMFRMLANPVTRAAFMNASTDLQGSTRPIPFRDMALEYDASPNRYSKANTYAVPSSDPRVGSLDYGQMPHRIPRVWVAGLRMFGGAKQAAYPHWFAGGGQVNAPALWLPPPKWSNPTRGTRSVSRVGKYSYQQMDRVSIPSVFVPTVMH